MLFNNKNGWTGNVTAFHNKIKNKIVSSGINCGGSDRIPSCAGFTNNTSFSINRDNAKTWGFELGTKYIISLNGILLLTTHGQTVSSFKRGSSWKAK